MKTQPDLNKLNFIKLHRKKRIIRMVKGRKGRLISNLTAMVLKNSEVIKTSQLESLRKLVIRKLKSRNRKNQKNLKIIKSQVKKVKKKNSGKKFKEKLLRMRYNFNLGLTKKPLQVRMGKGKGNPVDWVYPCSKNRILLEFKANKKVKESKIKRILIKASSKLASNIRFPRVNVSNRSFKKFKLIGSNSFTIKCLKDL